MYHFISGYTAKVAGTERGISEPVATFSPCYGGPFLTLHPLVYAELLNKKIKKHNVEVFLVNTGWIGGNPSSGAKRISIKNTRLMINAILGGYLDNTYYTKEKYFGLSIPDYVKSVDKKILNPINAWKDKKSYNYEALKLSAQFKENFKIYGKKVEYLINSGPLV
jgi:phosphoenolpyruvate carboxykinase (ATP)